MTNKDKCESPVKLATRGAALGLCVGMIGAVMASEIAANKELYLPATSGPYHLTRSDCLHRNGQNDFEVRKHRSTGLFVLVSGWKAIFYLVCPASLIFLYYQMAGRKKLAELLHLGELHFPAYSILVSSGYLRYGGCGWLGSHSPLYHTYLIISSDDLKNGVAFPFPETFPIVRKPATRSKKKERNKMWADALELT